MRKERRRKGNGIKGKEGGGRSESSRKDMKEEEKGRGGRKGKVKIGEGREKWIGNK